MARHISLPGWLIVLGAALAAASGCGDSPTQDAAPPGRILDFSVLTHTDRSATFTWTAPTDPPDGRPAVGYEFRYSTRSLEEDWKLSSVFPTGVPRAPGSPETLLVGPLRAKTRFNFGVQAADADGNWGAPSNIVWVETSDQLLHPPVSDFRVTTATHRSISVSWTAPGFGAFWTPVSYRLRYLRSTFVESWEHAEKVEGLPPPLPAGSLQSFTVYPLEPATSYILALEAIDDRGNRSSTAAAYGRTIADDVPPEPVSDLQPAAATASSITLEWTAPADEGGLGQVSSYDLRFAQEPIHEAEWPRATRVQAPFPPNAPGERERATIYFLEPSSNHFFALKAIDKAGNSSGLSNGAVRKTADPPRAWLVRPDGSGDFRRIREAVAAAGTGEAVLVGAGTYFENLDIQRDVTIRAEEGPELTVLDASGGWFVPAIVFGPETTPNTTLEGFTVTGTRYAPAILIDGGSPVIRAASIQDNYEGLGLRVEGGSPRILENEFRRNGNRNDPRSYGGAVLVTRSQIRPDAHIPRPVIERNVFAENQAGFGAAVQFSVSGGSFRDNRVEDNFAEYDGGAIFLWGCLDELVIEGNWFESNVAGDHGGAITAWGDECSGGNGAVRIRFNVFVRNRAFGEGARVDAAGGAISIGAGSGSIANNTFVGNIGVPDCGGGAIAIDGGRDWRIERNILAHNRGSGFACFASPTNLIVAQNLFYANAADFGCLVGRCDESIIPANVIEDPGFCKPEGDDFRVPADSPAFAGGISRGAYTAPGCARVAAEYRSQK